MFGDNVLAQSSLSGHNGTSQVDPEKIKYLKTLVQDRANMSDTEFEATWVKCLDSLKKNAKVWKRSPSNVTNFDFFL